MTPDQEISTMAENSLLGAADGNDRNDHERVVEKLDNTSSSVPAGAAQAVLVHSTPMPEDS
ncbi:10731_t:CDS:1, partial [Acaulospora morrowiae]